MQQADKNFSDALAAHHRGELATAQAGYERCLAHNHDHPSALVNLGSIHRNRGEIEAALRYFNRAVAIVPNDFAVRFNLAACRAFPYICDNHIY